MLSIIKTATKETLFYKLPTLLGDIVIQCGVLAFLLYGTGMVREKNLPLYEQTGSWFLLVISCLLTAWLAGVKVNERDRSAVNIANRAILDAAVTFILYNGLMAIIYELVLQGKLLLLQAVLTGFLYVIWHLLMRRVIARIRRRGANTYPVVLVGTEPNMLSAFRAMTESDDTGYKVLGFFTATPGDVPADVPDLGTPDEAFSYIETNHDAIKEVLCSLNPATETEYVQKLVATCENHMVRFKYVPGMEGYPKRKMTISQLGSVNVISLHDEPLNTPLAKFVKRSADVFFSGLFLVTLFPLVWLICAIGIKLSSPGPVFFKQKRTGYEGKEFWCYKFRSMHPSADADTKQAVKGDSRVFPFGKFLRKSSIDELPQFINVFRGDMSIIGPRPHMIHHTDIYSELIGDYMIRHLAKPGITGWAQVNGCRGETKELSEMKDRVEKDIWYIEHWSVELDVSIFLQTVWQILRHEDEKAY
ncbi:MAG: undecaprenyl-phosphate glucose phosphotransferase [Bacteroidales bacterium]|nr:undecaprenyl-phosphate glucose phosphotransferase [Bacteroidales bacterium]